MNSDADTIFPLDGVERLHTKTRRIYDLLGASDKIGAYVKDKPVRPQDLSATIYHALGVPFESRITKDGVSRPLSTGQPLLDLFG